VEQSGHVTRKTRQKFCAPKVLRAKSFALQKLSAPNVVRAKTDFYVPICSWQAFPAKA